MQKCWNVHLQVAGWEMHLHVWRNGGKKRLHVDERK